MSYELNIAFIKAERRFDERNQITRRWKKILRYKVFPESQWEMWNLVYEYKKIIKEKGLIKPVKYIKEDYDYIRDEYLIKDESK